MYPLAPGGVNWVFRHFDSGLEAKVERVRR